MNFEAKYEGYIWLSNEDSPIVYHQEKIDKKLFGTENPFIIEGQLYDNENMMSYSLKYVDGKLRIYQYQVKSEDYNLEQVESQTYIPNRMEDESGLKFLQYWRLAKDELCEDMEVLQPCEFVFVGFENKKEEDQK